MMGRGGRSIGILRLCLKRTERLEDRPDAIWGGGGVG